MEKHDSLDAYHEQAILASADREDAVTREVYAQFGLAFYLGNVFERGAIALLVFAAAASKRPSTAEEVDALFGAHGRKTLGRLLREVRESVTLPSEVDDVFGEALDLRNDLAHSFFWEKSEAFVTDSGKLAMLHELADASVLFEQAAKTLHRIAFEHGAKIGVTRERVDAETDRLMACLRRGDR